MKRRYFVFIFILVFIVSANPMTVEATSQQQENYGAPENPGVSLEYINDDSWCFHIGYTASTEVRTDLQSVADGSFANAGFNNYSIIAEVDYKLDDGSWKSVTSGEDELLSNNSDFSVEGGKYTSQCYVYGYELEDYFQDGLLPGGKSYFDNHTMSFRLRFCIDYDDGDNDYAYYSPWSDVVSYTNQQLEDPAKLINHTPVLKSAELKKYENNEPYIFVTAEIPHDDILKLNSISDQNVRTNIWLRMNSDQWKDLGTYGIGLEGFEVGINEYLNTAITDFEAAIYDIKFRYEFDYEYYPTDSKTGIIYSPFSNTISHGMPAYSNASSWAEAELDRGVEYGFITDKIKDQMNGPITREEFCEIVVKMIEKLTGTPLTYSQNPFIDTTNAEILKAYEAGVVKGIGQGKFAPNNLVTRQEIAVMMFRAVKVYMPQGDFSTSDVEAFTDEGEIASWAMDSVRFMFKNQILKGFGDRSVNPLGNTTREQAVLLIVRTFEKFKD